MDCDASTTAATHPVSAYRAQSPRACERVGANENAAASTASREVAWGILAVCGKRAGDLYEARSELDCAAASPGIWASATGP